MIHQDLGKDLHSSILLCGRSGTGKTSIAVNRMWAFYKYYQSSCHEKFNQVFVTANPVLRNEVRKSFCGMKAGFFGQRASGLKWSSSTERPSHGRELSNPALAAALQIQTEFTQEGWDAFGISDLGMDHFIQAGSSYFAPAAARAAQASDVVPPTFREVSPDLFPLFLTQAKWLKMIDGTLLEPFWPRHDDGSLKQAGISALEEDGMLDVLPDDDMDSEWSDDQDDDDDATMSTGEYPAEGAQRPESEKDTRIEVDFGLFASRLYPRLTAGWSKADLKLVSAASLWVEIHSYIKGSAEAVRSDTGRLSREQYNALGAKMAPLFKSASLDDLPAAGRGCRHFVYSLFEAYEAEKEKLNGYDLSDAVHYIYTQLEHRRVHERTPVHNIYVDETQDFTQAELALFLRVAEDKNGLFFSGDTCQTIALGVGFRFQDLTSLFHYEQQRQEKEAGGAKLPAREIVRVPKVHNLDVNYRTHNGILTAAAGLVDVIERYFGNTIDHLPRERGFFEGHKPVTGLPAIARTPCSCA